MKASRSGRQYTRIYNLQLKPRNQLRWTGELDYG